MLRHALEGHGHATIEARDEPEAIRLLQRSRPAVALTCGCPDRQRMITENILLKEELGRHRGFPEIVGRDPLMKVLSSLQRKPAGCPAAVREP